MKNLTWQNPEQLFVAQELINKVKSKCCGIKVYIGEMISEVMSEKNVSKAELARRLNIRPQSVDYMLGRKSIDTDTLYNVSVALDYDFAQLYSIKKNQIDFDKPHIHDKCINKAKIVLELELEKEDLIKLNIKKKISSLLE